MGPLEWTVGTTVLISFLAWIGVFTLFLRDDLLDHILLVLVALAAGAMLGGAFFHLLPRSIAAAEGDLIPVFVVLVIGFSTFYILEGFIDWHHHHASERHHHEPVSYLVLAADTIHNFIDGLVIAGAFLLSVELGLVTAAAIALHEIPQEIGDYGVLVYGGFDRLHALVLNYITQATVILGGIAGYFFSGFVQGVPAFLLPFAAGTFIYIASSDLIPEIKHEDDVRKAGLYFVVFVVGILLMLGIRILRGYLG